MVGPSERVLDLFAVPGRVEPLPGGQGLSVRAGDLVLSPGRDATTAAWLNPVLARLAVRLDEEPGRRRRDLRVAMPVPARDGAWVVDGWGASRFEPGTVACGDLDVTLAAGRLLHARFAVDVPRCPEALATRADRWSQAERVAFGDTPADDAEVARVVSAADALGAPAALGSDQLVHADLGGNLLLDAAGAPVVIDVAPAWRPPLWAEAVAVADGVAWHDAPTEALGRWVQGRERQALLRALAFRLASDVADPASRGAYARILDLIGAGPATSGW